MSNTTVNTSYGVRPDKHTTDAISKLQPENGVIVFDKDTKQNDEETKQRHKENIHRLIRSQEGKIWRK